MPLPITHPRDSDPVSLQRIPNPRLLNTLIESIEIMQTEQLAATESITLLRSSDGSLVNTIPLLGAPHHLQFDGVGMWVATKETQPSVTDPSCSNGQSCAVTGERWFLTLY